MRSAFRLRLRILLGALGVLALLIFVRLYFVQVVYAQDYALKAERQYASQSQALFDRGSIYFTRKDGTLISAATLETGFLLAINPEKLAHPEAAYSALSAIAPFDRDVFLTAAARSNDPYEEIVHHLTDAQGRAMADLEIPGVIVLRERWRSYPGGSLAAQTIGFLGYNGGSDLTGQYGLEKQYDAVLSRTDSTYRNFFAQLFSNLGDAVVDASQAREGDIVTTIEPDVETRLVKDLQAVEAKYHSKETGGIIMDPRTGAIIALGSVPSFDPNDFSQADPKTFKNPIVSNVYEFGSIVKALTMASGLDAGVVTPETTYDDTGCITVNTKRICNWDFKARGVIPMQQILSQSLNVGASFIATRLGPDRFRAYFTKLGFGAQTGIDLPSEQSGLISNLKSPRQVEYDTASFGQGIAVSPIEMVRALGALANHGVMVQPHIVDSIRLSSGITKHLEWGKQYPVFSAQATQDVSRMLTSVVDVNLSNGTVKIPSMSVAAKTGTAQLASPDGGYYKDRFFHSFFGYFPSYDPRFIILLYTNDPQGVEYASETLTSTFMDLVHYLIDYYQVPPDRAPTV